MNCPASILDYRVCTTTKNRFLFVHKNSCSEQGRKQVKIGKKKKTFTLEQEETKRNSEKRTRFDALLEMEKEMN